MEIEKIWFYCFKRESLFLTQRTKPSRNEGKWARRKKVAKSQNPFHFVYFAKHFCEAFGSVPFVVEAFPARNGRAKNLKRYNRLYSIF